MIERERNSKELNEAFKVLGSTGNVYTVRIDTLPSCDCKFAALGAPLSAYSHVQVPMPSKGITVNILYVISLFPSDSTDTSFAVIRLSEGMQRTCRPSLDYMRF
jgi:hypothetical protein